MNPTNAETETGGSDAAASYVAAPDRTGAAASSTAPTPTPIEAYDDHTTALTYLVSKALESGDPAMLRSINTINVGRER